MVNIKLSNKFTVLCLLLLILLVSLPISAQTLEEVKYSGNYHVPEKLLNKAVTNLKPGEEITKEKIKKDVQNIFKTGFFYEVNANIKGNTVIFLVKQNPILTNLDIKGNKLVSNEEIKNEITTSVNRIYNEKRLKEDIVKIYNLYKEKGYLGTQVENALYYKDSKTSTEKAERGFLKLVLQEGLVKNIKIVGLNETDKKIIQPLVEVKEGEYLTVKQAENTVQAIYDTKFFKKVDMETEITEQKDGINVIFKVDEAKTGSYEFGVGYNEKKGTMLIGNIKEMNLLGTGKQIGLESDINELGYEVSGFYNDPYLSENYELNLDFQVGKEEVEENEEITETDYQMFSTRLTRKTDHGNYYGGLNIENYDSNLERNNHGRLVALDTGYYIDTTNKNLNPNSGSYINVNMELADERLGSEINYNKFTGTYYQYFKGVKQNHAVATKLVLGTGSEGLPYYKEFIASNTSHLKSYEYGDLRGNRLVVGSLEYRVPIWKEKMVVLGGITFGDAWNTDNRKSDIKTELVLGTKFNLLNMGNIRVDYAYNKEKEGKFQISMQNKF